VIANLLEFYRSERDEVGRSASSNDRTSPAQRLALNKLAN
jgi:hypothetical protein